MHTGYCKPTPSPPPAAIQELRVTIRILPSQESKLKGFDSVILYFKYTCFEGYNFDKKFSLHLGRVLTMSVCDSDFRRALP